MRERILSPRDCSHSGSRAGRHLALDCSLSSWLGSYNVATPYKATFACNASLDGSGYNSKYGLLGSNLATGEKVKLFPETGDELVHKVQKNIKEIANVDVEVMVYGDGAFKDPQGKIWELADPVVSPFHTEGLKGTPNELKIKYLADNEFKDLKGEALNEAIREKINNKAADLKGTNQTLGTTPRQITDLLGSLCDLTSGSGDKGTPIILVQGYFDNFSSK